MGDIPLWVRLTFGLPTFAVSTLLLPVVLLLAGALCLTVIGIPLAIGLATGACSVEVVVGCFLFGKDLGNNRHR
jgi:hypothetical protein